MLREFELPCSPIPTGCDCAARIEFLHVPRARHGDDILVYICTMIEIHLEKLR